MPTIRVLVVDDHTIFRSGLARLFSDEPDIQVAGEAPNGAAALAQLRSAPFDLVLMDISMEGRNGLEVVDALRAEFPKLPVLMLSMYREEQYAMAAIKAGANGYLTKDSEPEELIRAIRAVSTGQRYLTQRGTEMLLRQVKGEDDRPAHQRLSAREFEIMKLIVEGVSLTDIGRQMFISVKTVSTYRNRLLTKLGLGSNAELVKFCVQNGLFK